MRQISRLVITVCSAMLPLTQAFADLPNTDNPTTFLGPIARLGFTTTINDETAGSVAGELGLRNYRLGGTLGWTDTENNRFKFSAEYLWQNINYAFLPGNRYQWVSQGALGADYQYLFQDYDYDPQLDLNAYASYAPSKYLSSVPVSYINRAGTAISGIDQRHIAGSNAYGLSPGLNITPWSGGFFGINVNYDYVKYNTVFIPTKKATGLGGTAQLSQQLDDNFEIGFLAAVRKPFNHYQANLSLTEPTCYGTWIFGLNGAYTLGKRSLPSTYNIGLSADYLMDRIDKGGETQKKARQTFLSWISKPAVYMPQVLAIAEDGLCIPPSFSGQIGTDQGGGVIGFFTPFANANIAGNFTGNNLHYRIDLNGNANAGGLTISQQGILSDPNIDNILDLSITATNSCGSATSNLFALVNTA